MLEHSLERVVIDVLVYIERCEDIKCVAKVYLPWNGRINLEDREKMCGANNGIDVNNRHDLVIVAVKIWFNNPHFIVGVRVFVGLGEVMDECTQEEFAVDLEREKQVDSGNIQAAHSWIPWAGVQGDCVMSGSDDGTHFPPRGTVDSLAI